MVRIRGELFCHFCFIGILKLSSAIWNESQAIYQLWSKERTDWNYFEAGSTLCKNQSNKFFWCCCWSIEDICPSLSLLPVILVFCQGWCPLSGTMSFSGWFGTKCSSTTHPCQHLPTIDIDSAENIKIFCKILRYMSTVSVYFFCQYWQWYFLISKCSMVAINFPFEKIKVLMLLFITFYVTNNLMLINQPTLSPPLRFDIELILMVKLLLKEFLLILI